MQKKKGISLIVLTITIIIMLILAVTVILTLKSAGIIEKSNDAVEKNDLAQIKNIAALKWSEAFNDESVTDIEDYVLYALIQEGVDLSNYDIKVTEVGVDVNLKTKVPSQWKENVAAIVDGVPIPKGFVASQATGEDTKVGGLVIYEGTEVVTDENVEKAKRTRNQYVWIPIAHEDFTTKFVRGCYNETSYSNTLGNAYWEVALDLTTNMPLVEQSSKYITSITLAEVQAMYASVKTYEGFYIARYEAGIDTQRASNNGVLETKVYSMMGKIPYTYIPWTKNNKINEDTNGAVQVARTVYPVTDKNSTYGVVSTLIYSVQWDAVMQWWLNTKAVQSVGVSVDYGNYTDHVITSANDLNEGAKVGIYNTSTYEVEPYISKNDETLIYPKAKKTTWALSTGALKAANVNNIYDMAGNMAEWTMEGDSFGGNVNHRVFRGGHCSGGVALTGSYPVTYRQNTTINDANRLLSFRVALYIKQ